ncbi:response regulator transcription factor [Lewinella sp. 4G2]|uniref:response regulator transcription factor n=1 Tax=Lewinella sp. 4G2 TaxID=1803372 RepID=UPI0007B4D4F4|nr:response regulator transcription factor [Lewinella sp. 4G2]OAV44565.1 DNA-binding response regulator [Lewinella sp. 4G2]
MPIKIVLVDDHALVRDGIKSLLEDAENLEVIGEAGDGAAGVLEVTRKQPDLVILDIRMPKMNGIEAVRELKRLGSPVRCLMLSMHDSEEYVLQSIDAGAHGYLMKDANRDEFLKAIHTIMAGDRYFSGDLTDILVRQIMRRPVATVTPTPSNAAEERVKISKRQQQILQEVVKGASNQEIADQLGLSRRTVETHRYKLMDKLAVGNKRELIDRARTLGLV